MKHVYFRAAAVICSLALTLLLSITHANKKFATARYKQTNAGSTCFPPATLPEDCTSTVTGIICETSFGTTTRKWYTDACVTPYYMWP